MLVILIILVFLFRYEKKIVGNKIVILIFKILEYFISLYFYRGFRVFFGEEE